MMDVECEDDEEEEMEEIEEEEEEEEENEGGRDQIMSPDLIPGLPPPPAIGEQNGNLLNGERENERARERETERKKRDREVVCR